MNRRSFLKNTGKLGIALSLPAIYSFHTLDFLTSESLIDKHPFFKLSLAQWSLHNAIKRDKTLDALDFSKKAKELGFDAVDYVNQLFSIDHSNRTYSINNLVKELNIRSKDNGIENSILMVDNEGGLASASQVKRDKAVENHARWVDAAAGLGCNSVRVNLLGPGTENDFNLWKEASVDALGRLAKYAEGSNINVIVENHGGMSSDAGKLTQIMREINLKNCGTLPDFGNFCTKTDNDKQWGKCIEKYDCYQGVEELMPFAKGVSAKTYDFDSKGNETSIDYLKMLKIVKDSGFNGYIGIEYEGERLSEEQGIKATRELILKVSSKFR